MAIIRKGDRKAEAKLKARADKEDSDKMKRGLKSLKDTPDGKRAKKVRDNKGVTGAQSAVYLKTKVSNMNKPVSGSELAISKNLNNRVNARATRKGGAGVIEKGKLVKGGNEDLKTSLDTKGKK